MKRFISTALIFSIVCLGIFAIPQPVRAGESTSNIIIFSIGGAAIVGCIIGVICAMNNLNNVNEEAAKKAEKDKANAKAAQDAMLAGYFAKIGKWTYDEMLIEFGKPTEETSGDTVKIAVYDKTVMSSVGNTVYVPGNMYNNASAVSSAVNVKNGEIWTFTFNKATKKLIQYNYKKYENNNLNEFIGKK
jgi:hypothetical protein